MRASVHSYSLAPGKDLTAGISGASVGTGLIWELPVALARGPHRATRTAARLCQTESFAREKRGRCETTKIDCSKIGY